MMDSYDDAIIEAVSLETGRRQVVVERGTNAHYISDGHLVFARNGALFAVPFDPIRLVVTGPSVHLTALIRTMAARRRSVSPPGAHSSMLRDTRTVTSKMCCGWIGTATPNL